MPRSAVVGAAAPEVRVVLDVVYVLLTLAAFVAVLVIVRVSSR